jgi:D-alanyl-D-alanine carboxypeptidase (penicillin-binding protein 5/6)
MCKRMLPAVFALALLFALAAPAFAAGPDVPVPSAVLMDEATGTVLYEKDDHAKMPPASVTKVMTLLLVMEALDSGRIGWDDMVTASAAAAGKGGSQVFLEENERMPLRDMVKSVVVSSANDCATALAEHIAGSESAFVEMMNQRAAALGMQDTHFVNCTGLDDEPDAREHLTTAYDIALMSRELLKHKEIRKYTTIWMDTVRDGRFGLSNTNKLVRFYDGTTGLKTGYTSAAGYCLSASAERNGLELIAVVLHGKTSAERFESAKALLNYGFSNYALVTPAPESAIPAVSVTLGTEDAVTPVLKSAEPILADKAKAATVKTEVTVDESVDAPVAEGQQLGTLRVKSGDEVLSEIPLVAPKAVPRLTWLDLWLRILKSVAAG